MLKQSGGSRGKRPRVGGAFLIFFQFALGRRLVIDVGSFLTIGLVYEQCSRSTGT